MGSAAGGGVAADYAVSHPDRLLSLVINSNPAGLSGGDIVRRKATNEFAAQRLRRHAGRLPRAGSVLPRRQSGGREDMARTGAQGGDTVIARTPRGEPATMPQTGPAQPHRPDRRRGGMHLMRLNGLASQLLPAGHRRDTREGRPAKPLISLALPRGLEPLFSP